MMVQMLLLLFLRVLLIAQWRDWLRYSVEQITIQKKLFKVKKNNVTTKDKRPLLLFYFTDFEYVFVGWVISFIFYFLD